jgi:dUTPase
MEIKSMSDYDIKNGDLTGSYWSKPIPEFKFALREDIRDDKRFLPTRGEPFATGYDVRACPEDRKDIILRPGQYFKIPLGIKSFCPEGWYYQLHPRSSSFAKKHMHNLIGIIDEHYSLELLFAGQYVPDINAMGKDLVIKFGDAVGQIVPAKRIDVIIKEISNKEYDDLCRKRISIRTGGFGSTDNK